MFRMYFNYSQFTWKSPKQCNAFLGVHRNLKQRQSSGKMEKLRVQIESTFLELCDI